MIFTTYQVLLDDPLYFLNSCWTFFSYAQDLNFTFCRYKNVICIVCVAKSLATVRTILLARRNHYFWWLSRFHIFDNVLYLSRLVLKCWFKTTFVAHDVTLRGKKQFITDMCIMGISCWFFVLYIVLSACNTKIIELWKTGVK